MFLLVNLILQADARFDGHLPTNVDHLIKRSSPVQRKKVDARAAELMAEEMTLIRRPKPLMPR